MTPLRRVLGPATAIWLLCQFGAAASVTVTLWANAADPHTEECTCGHEAGAICPMHHKPAGQPTRCAMQAANSSGTAVLTMVVGVAGLTSEPTVSIRRADFSTRSLPGNVRVVSERPVPPDPPPPRT